MNENWPNKILAALLGVATNDSAQVAEAKRQLAAAITEAERPKPPPRMAPEQQAELLRAAFSRYTQTNRFNVGQLVKWKPGLRRRNFPEHGQPCVILELLDQPVFDGATDSGNAFFKDPLDIKIGAVWVPTGDMFVYYENSARFEPF